MKINFLEIFEWKNVIFVFIGFIIIVGLVVVGVIYLRLRFCYLVKKYERKY